MSRWRDRIRISGGFWLLAAWFTLVNGWRLLAVILSAAALHELGHLLVLRLLGARVRELRVSVFGAELVTTAARLSYPGEIAAVLAEWLCYRQTENAVRYPLLFSLCANAFSFCCGLVLQVLVF